MSLKNWMSIYQDRELGEMHLPGSHDAGTTKNYIEKTKFGTDSNSATQNLTIDDQMEAGTRFFDLRLAQHGGNVVAHHTTKGQGAYSRITVDAVLDGARKFCKANPTEVVIFRISHTSLATNAHDIVKASGGDQLHTGTGNLATKTLGDIVADGGGLICLLEEATFGAKIDQSSGVHGFAKYATKAANSQGLSCCGCYSMTHELHQVVCNGLKGQYDHNVNHAQRNKHLWQVYWQKTYVNPASGTGIESGTKAGRQYDPKKKVVHGGTHAATGYMLRLMSGLGRLGQEDYELEKEESHKKGVLRKKVIDKQRLMYSTLDFRNYSLPNIFSYDFVNKETNKKIIAMNNKGLQAANDSDSEDG